MSGTGDNPFVDILTEQVVDDGSCNGCKFENNWTPGSICYGCIEGNNLYQPLVPVEPEELAAAIQHAREIAEREGCTDCGNEHKQLVEWLCELVRLRDETTDYPSEEIPQPKPKKLGEGYDPTDKELEADIGVLQDLCSLLEVGLIQEPGMYPKENKVHMVKEVLKFIQETIIDP